MIGTQRKHESENCLNELERKKGKEESSVLFGNAVTNPRTMMVVGSYTSIASSAML